MSLKARISSMLAIVLAIFLAGTGFGLYGLKVANNSFEGDQNMSGTQGIEIVQYLSETPSIQYPIKAKDAKVEKRNDKGLSATGEAQETFETFQREASQR